MNDLVLKKATILSDNMRQISNDSFIKVEHFPLYFQLFFSLIKTPFGRLIRIYLRIHDIDIIISLLSINYFDVTGQIIEFRYLKNGNVFKIERIINFQNDFAVSKNHIKESVKYCLFSPVFHHNVITRFGNTSLNPKQIQNGLIEMNPSLEFSIKKEEKIFMYFSQKYQRSQLFVIQQFLFSKYKIWTKHTQLQAILTGKFPIIQKKRRTNEEWELDTQEQKENPPLRTKMNFEDSFFENFRLCFQILPPQIGRKRWIIYRCVQSRIDPSLFIPIHDFYNEKYQKIVKKYFGELPSEVTIAQIYDLLKEDIGRTATHFKGIEQFERNPMKKCVYITAEEAYYFLKTVSLKLQNQGYGIMAPNWWGNSSSQIGLKLEIDTKDDSRINLGLLNANSLLDYKWHISIGDMEISDDEFEYLLQLKTPLVSIRDRWVELDENEIYYISEFLNKKKKTKYRHNKKVSQKQEVVYQGEKDRQGKNPIDLKSALLLSLKEGRLENGPKVVSVNISQSLQTIFAQFKQSKNLNLVNPPKNFNGSLRSYQHIGLSWINFMSKCGFGVCLADDMGLGKTIQIIAFLLHQHETSSSNLKPTLIVCPLSLIDNWKQELTKFGPCLHYYVHYGSERLRGKKFQAAIDSSHVVITSYHQLKHDKNFIKSVEWENIIIDEAQNIKNHYTQTSQTVKLLKSNFKVALTGTPIENGLRELWSIMDFLNPGLLGDLKTFSSDYCFPIEKYGDKEKIHSLNQILSPFLMRRTKLDKNIRNQFPKKEEKIVYTYLTTEQAVLYQGVVNNLMENLTHSDHSSRAGLILTSLTKLKQICNHPALFLHENNPWNIINQQRSSWYRSNFSLRSGKFVQMINLMQNIILKKEKAVIFTQYREMGNFLQSFLQDLFKIPVLYLHGGISRKDRDLMINHFQAESNSTFFILSIRAGGVGINLTNANHVFHFDRWWNPAVEDQATDRVYRIGQSKEVNVTKFVTRGTIEEKINQMIELKKGLAIDILRNQNPWLLQLNNFELNAVLSLGENWDNHALITS